MSEYGIDDGGYGVDDYGGGNVTVPAGTPYTPEVIPRVEIPVMPPPPPRAPRGGLSGLGELSPIGVCVVRALDQVAYRFFQEVATGTTVQALSTLNVYRALYNTHRGSVVPGLPAVYQSLPTTLAAAEWSTPMRQVVSNMFAVALGTGHPALAALASLPPAISGITAWFTSFQRALVPGDLATLRAYLEIPTVTGTAPDVALARTVVDDLRTCGVTPPPAPPAPPSAPPRANPAPTQQVVSGGRSGAGAGGASTTSSAGASVIQQSAIGVGRGVGSMLTLGLVAFGAYGLYLAINDKSGGASPSKLGLYSQPELAEKARKAATHDATKMKCLIPAAERATVSFDETAGPKGYALSKKLTKIPAAEANAIEALYWTELEALKPGKICASE
jgi:hypothetical protein